MTTYAVMREIHADPQIIWDLDGPIGFSMKEVLSGLLEPMISKSIPDMTDSFEQFADGLKRTAESR